MEVVEVVEVRVSTSLLISSPAHTRQPMRQCTVRSESCRQVSTPACSTAALHTHGSQRGNIVHQCTVRWFAHNDNHYDR
jgi:hypothetical protein